MIEGKSCTEPEDGYLLPWLLVDASVFELKSSQRLASCNITSSESSDHHDASSDGMVVEDNVAYHGHHLQHVWDRSSSTDMTQMAKDSTNQGWNIELHDIIVLSRLGEGSTSEVFVGQWQSQLAAVKVMKEGTPSRDFLNEVRTARNLPAHKNIVSFLGVCTSFQVPVAIYEYLPGGTLDELLISEENKRAQRKGAPDSRNQTQLLLQSVSWMRDLLSALEFLHGLTPKLLHRDVKPANLFLNADRTRLKLGDFGLCREEASDKDTRCMTGVSGSLRYMAPEVYLSESNYDSSVDIWSASMVMWAAMARQRPFSSLADEDAVELVARHGLRPPRESVRDQRLAHVIERGLSAEAAARPSALEISWELSVVQEKLRGGKGAKRKSSKLWGVGGKLQTFVAKTRKGVLNGLVQDRQG